MAAVEGDGRRATELIERGRQSSNPRTVCGVHFRHGARSVSEEVGYPNMGAVESDVLGLGEPVAASAVGAAVPVQLTEPDEIRQRVGAGHGSGSVHRPDRLTVLACTGDALLKGTRREAT